MLAAIAFAAASIQLYGRLWFELERLNVPAAEIQLLTIRLEVVLLLDACDSKTWQVFLSPDERVTLETTLRTILDIIAVPRPARTVIHRAQDCLFDAVVEQCQRYRAALPANERERLAG
ncbi:MAG TPA: hypothetical protein VK696_02670 [Steroidobacteraceae bacterium]|jgi:hypothetical protein|nr:hypothetical protein [Steroidobacteraceae bacterium]